MTADSTTNRTETGVIPADEIAEPAACALCEQEFARMPMLQAELRHVAATEGPAAARMELNDRLADVHAEHARPGTRA